MELHLLNYLFLILCGWFAAYLAAKKGRGAILWFFLGLFLNIFALLILIFLPPVTPTKNKVSKEPPFQGTTIDVKPLASSDSIETPPKPEGQEWYYLDAKRQQTGPINFDTLRNLYCSTIISDSTYLWCEGMKEWKKLSELNLNIN